MANYRKAPKLYHDIDKAKLGFRHYYSIPQKIINIIFSKLDGKHGNQIKLMITLLGTIGNGTFGVSEKWITDCCGFSQQRYIDARKSLVELEWLEVKDKKITVKITNILKSGVDVDVEYNPPCDSVDDLEEAPCQNNNPPCDGENPPSDSIIPPSDGVRNKEIINNNKELIKEEDEFSDFYLNLSLYYNIQNENDVKKRIGNKLPDSVDKLDFFDFWLNIKSELYKIRDSRKKKVSSNGALEFDLKVALNKYNEYLPKLIAAGYKMYRTDILKAYSQEAFKKACSAVSGGYYIFTNDYLYAFNFNNDKYQISTYMKYRNAEEKRLAKINNRSQGDTDCANEY